MAMNVKNTVTTLFILFSFQSFACDCDAPSITEKFIKSEFVARATIVKNYKNESSQELYKADIIISKLYKGEFLESIYVSGRSDGMIGSSCSIYIPENTELIIYAEKQKDGKYSIGMCSGLLYLTKQKERTQKRELKILKTFKANNVERVDKINYQVNVELYTHLRQFRGIKLDKSFGIYEITFTHDLKIKNVKEISGFNDVIDARLMGIIKQTRWASFDKGIKNSIPEDSKVLVGIYFYPEEKGNPSFLSYFYH